MGFVAGKLLRFILAPGNLLVLLLAWGVIRLVRSRGGRGRVLVASVTVVLVAIAALPLGQWMIAPLEHRFPVPTLPERVDGIVLLGGAVEPRVTGGRIEPVIDTGGDRVFGFLALARRYPTAKLLLVGGESAIFPQGHSEAEVTRDLLVAQGLAPERMLIEPRSRNTIENAIFAQALAKPGPGETWLLVTSAVHMPRAIGCFRHAGWSVVAFPTDFRAGDADDWSLAFTPHLALVELATREWLGLLAYRLLGRIDVLFPGPPS
jgi:uncharacterized SAM-binding protein YcdF (DUF218 family)